MDVIDHEDEGSWLLSRSEFVCASEIAGLLGHSRFSSRRRLWVEKRNRIIDKYHPSPEAKFGKRVEHLIAEDFEEASGMTLFDPGDFALAVDREHRMAATLDRFIDNMHPVELKTAWRDQAYRWDTEVPIEYQMQMMAQLAVTDAPIGYFAVWLFKGAAPIFRLHPINRDEKVIEVMRSKVAEFWQSVADEDPPAVDGLEHTNYALQQQYRSPVDEERTLENPILADRLTELAQVQEDLERSAQRERELKQTFMDALGNSTTGRLVDGRRVKWKPDKRGVRRFTFDRETQHGEA